MLGNIKNWSPCPFSYICSKFSGRKPRCSLFSSSLGIPLRVWFNNHLPGWWCVFMHFTTSSILYDHKFNISTTFNSVCYVIVIIMTRMYYCRCYQINIMNVRYDNVGYMIWRGCPKCSLMSCFTTIWSVIPCTMLILASIDVHEIYLTYIFMIWLKVVIFLFYSLNGRRQIIIIGAVVSTLSHCQGGSTHCISLPGASLLNHPYYHNRNG